MQDVQKPGHKLHGIRLHTDSKSLLTGYHHCLQKLVGTDLPIPINVKERLFAGIDLQDVQEHKSVTCFMAAYDTDFALSHVLCGYWLTPTLVTYVKLVTSKEGERAQSNAKRRSHLSYTK